MRIAPLLLLTCSALAAGCGGGDSGLAPTAVRPTAETFRGTLPLQTISSHIFTVSRTGTVDISLPAVGPPDNVRVYIGVGTPTAAGGCALAFLILAVASPAVQISGTATPGAACVAVLDAFEAGYPLTGEIEYTVIVSHT